MEVAELKLNIGCGVSGVPGWVNIDNSPTILLSRLPWGRRVFHTPNWPDDVRRIDVRKGIPYPDSSVSYIYTSHAYHLFTYEDSLALAKECFRVLRAGGILRIVVPDLGMKVREYLADPNPEASHRLMARLFPNLGFRDIVHPGTHHRQMFDARSLTYILKKAGFATPEVSAFGASRIPEILKIELESRAWESLYVECVR
jgi:predicted SAM-dependent methyltransferase